MFEAYEKVIVTIFLIFLGVFSLLMKRFSYTQKIENLIKKQNMILNYLAEAIIELEEGNMKKSISNLDSIRNYVPELNRIIEDKKEKRKNKF